MKEISAAIAPLLTVVQAIIALFAVILAAVAVWKIGMNPMGVDAQKPASSRPGSHGSATRQSRLTAQSIGLSMPEIQLR